jgi:Phospholipase D Active site motif
MAVDVLRVADRVAGDAIEGLTSAHHARRLAKLGRSAQRSPPEDGCLWAAGDPPPRAGNAIEVLIEGAAYFPALEQAIRAARRSVLIAGWCITPGFALVRDEPPVLVRELLGEAAESVDLRVLLWAGAPVPVFTPRRSSVRQGRDWLVRGTRIKAALDSNERPMHCHHEKLVVIDDELAFVGGIDLTDLGGDRYDTPEHPGRGRMGWHDVASRLRGPVVADVGRHVAQRWQSVTGERLEAQPSDVASAGDVELQIVRTVPEKLYEFAPRGEFRIIESYLRALRSAQRLVYLENQFLWSPEVVNILAEKLRRPPADEFRVIIICPADRTPERTTPAGSWPCSLKPTATRDVFWPRRSGRARAKPATECTCTRRSESSTTAGSRWARRTSTPTLSSTTPRSTSSPATLRSHATRDTRLWAAHLECDIDAVAGDPSTVVDQLWRPIAAGQRERWDRGEPLTHKLVELPATSRRSERLLGPLQALLVDG